MTTDEEDAEKWGLDRRVFIIRDEGTDYGNFILRFDSSVLSTKPLKDTKSYSGWVIEETIAPEYIDVKRHDRYVPIKSLKFNYMGGVI